MPRKDRCKLRLHCMTFGLPMGLGAGGAVPLGVADRAGVPPRGQARHRGSDCGAAPALVAAELPRRALPLALRLQPQVTACSGRFGALFGAKV